MKTKFLSSLSIALLCISSISKAQPLSLQWVKGMGGSSYDAAFCMKTDVFGNIISAGYFNGTVDFDPGVGVSNLSTTSNSVYCMFISKLDANGDYVWARAIGGASVGTNPYSLALDNLGNMYICGYFNGKCDFDPGPGTHTLNGVGYNDVFVLKLDAGGNFVWVKGIIGQLPYKTATSIAVDASGNVFTTGSFAGTVDFDPGSGVFTLSSNGGVSYSDAYVLKLDALGNFVWAQKIGSFGDDIGYSIAVDNQGNVLTTGYFQNTADFDPGTATYSLVSAGYNDAYILKLDQQGNFVWAKGLGSTYDDVGLAVYLDPGGNVYASGTFSGTIDFDPGPGTFNLSVPYSSPTQGPKTRFIVKLDAAGNFGWARSMGGKIESTGGVMTIDASGNIYTTGSFKFQTDFDPELLTVYNLTGDDSSNVFISKLDVDGNFIWAEQVGGTSDDAGYSISIDAGGNIYVAGIFNRSANFDFAGNTTTLTSNGKSDAFVMKIKEDANVNGIKRLSYSPVGFYPNPASDYLHVQGLTGKNFTLNVFNELGQLVFEKSFTPALNGLIDLSRLAPGIYVVELRQGQTITRTKIVKQ